MKRIVQPEILDTLPPGDPRALRSRRDLRRINSWMSNPSIVADAVKNNLDGRAPKQITEIGAGDGDFLLRVAQKMNSPDVSATLLDLQKNIPAETLAAFSKLGWRAEAIIADVFDWPQTSNVGEIVIANLFLHHFTEAQLAKLFGTIAKRARLFVAVEPRRAPATVFFSRLLWVIGCNDVTRHDAAISVRAGFSGEELSALWPDKSNWQLTEHRAGFFSHLFIAQKIS
jgi:hypothetical protein